MAGFRRFEEIGAWQQGRTLVQDIYRLSRTSGLSKDLGLRDQVQRAAISICSNIAEGFERRGNKEFIKFLWIAKGSAAEVSSQLYHLQDIGYISEDEFADLQGKVKRIGATLHLLIESIPDPNRLK